MKKTIVSIFEERVTASSLEIFRTPLVGYAGADNPDFGLLKTLVGPGHLTPEDVLPGAKSVVAFFLPFQRGLVQGNLKHEYVSKDWAKAYIHTNRLIEDICQEVGSRLSERGIKTAWQKPTHNFDQEKLVSFWSHKHVAYFCGLGTFGLNHMLITKSGCAGRLGSFVTDLPLEADPVQTQELCLYKAKNKCRACITLCPTGSLSGEGIDRHRCYQQLLEVDAFYSDLGLCDVCGKCAAGPCAHTAPTDRG